MYVCIHTKKYMQQGQHGMKSLKYLLSGLFTEKFTNPTPVVAGYATKLDNPSC